MICEITAFQVEVSVVSTVGEGRRRMDSPQKMGSSISTSAWRDGRRMRKNRMVSQRAANPRNKSPYFPPHR